MNFQTGGTKLETFFPKSQHTQKKLLIFENWCIGDASKSALIFYVENHWNLSQFFLLREYQFRSENFVIDIF